MKHGDELILTSSHPSGAVLGLNLLLNLHELGYRHGLMVANDPELCPTLGAAVSRLDGAAQREAVAATPCLTDSWWQDFLGGRVRAQYITWSAGAVYIRASILARLARLGYNTLAIDCDMVLLDNLYPHLHARALAGTFHLMVSSGYQHRSN